MFLIVLIGILYLVIGFISLSIALLFVELERPRDLIQSGLLILLGILFLIYKNIFTLKMSLILTLNAVLISFYFIEIFSYKWNQLLDKEKFDIKSLTGFKKNFSAIYISTRNVFKNIHFNNKFKNIFKRNSIKKKWVRKLENNNKSNNGKLPLKESISNIKTADFSKEDIMNDDENQKKNTQTDN